MNESTTRESFLRLALTPGVGPQRLRRLLSLFGSADAVLAAPRDALSSVEGVGPVLAGKLAEQVNYDIAPLLERMKAVNCTAYTWLDASYPTLLASIPDPPPLLFVRGNADFSVPAVAIVGTRHATPHGLRMATKLARGLVDMGLVIVSGLALGIDGAAHRGALEAGGCTWAVLGCGPDGIYPPEHKELADSMLNHYGALISSYAPGTAPAQGNFPARNRLISGLAVGVVIVEAPERSGALITARTALEQGREVFAVPGMADSPTAIGANRLIKDGAHLVMEAQDVFDGVAQAIINHYGDKVHPDSSIQQDTVLTPTVSTLPTAHNLPPLLQHTKTLDKLAERIITQLSTEPLHADDLSRKLELSASELAGKLVDMELEGLVSKLPGNMYILGEM